MKKVKGKRVSNGALEYHVAWEGNWADEWQPEWCLAETAQGAIDAYLESLGPDNQTKKGRKRKRAGRS